MRPGSPHPSSRSPCATRRSRSRRCRASCSTTRAPRRERRAAQRAGITLGAGEFSGQGNNLDHSRLQRAQRPVPRWHARLRQLLPRSVQPRDGRGAAGPASVLFGRGSTGGVDQPGQARAARDSRPIAARVVGTDATFRATADVATHRRDRRAAFRLNLMGNEGRSGPRRRAERSGSASPRRSRSASARHARAALLLPPDREGHPGLRRAVADTTAGAGAAPTTTASRTTTSEHRRRHGTACVRHDFNATFTPTTRSVRRTTRARAGSPSRGIPTGARRRRRSTRSRSIAT